MRGATIRKATTRAASAGALLEQASRALAAGDAATAEHAARAVLADDAGNAAAVQLLGAVLVDRDDVEEALTLFDSARDAVGAPSVDTCGFHNNHANALRRAGRLPEAETLLRELTTVAPREWQPWHNLGQTLKDMGRLDEAAAAMRRACALAPEFGPNYGVLGEILHKLGRLHSADAAFRRCIELGWDTDATLWTWLGNNERLLGRTTDAVGTLEHALALSGGTAGAHSNLGLVLLQAGRLDDAIASFERAIALAPEQADLHANLGYALLSAGQLDRAWDEWEHGLLDGPRGKRRYARTPPWTPGDDDCRVLVYREQGIGDEIMFASCYPDLVATARDVVIECSDRLVDLFARSFPDATVRAAAGANDDECDCDRVVAAGTLPRYVRRSLADFPAAHRFLVPDPARVERWRERLAGAGPRPYVGISWRSRVKTAERRLEYTRLEEWGDLFAVPGVTWINLQYDDCERELRDAERLFGVRVERWDWLDLMNDFEEVAALTAALDLVVAPRNAVAMLSGGLAVDTVVLANNFAWADLGTDHNPWLPTLRLFRRRPNEEWDGVLRAAVRAVAEVADRARPAAPAARS